MESGARLRREPAASGGDPARRQSRHPRGARPAEDPCRGGARAARRRRPGRPPARFPRPGVRPRGQYPVRQGQRRLADRARGLNCARKSSNCASRSRTSNERSHADAPPRHDPDPVLALGRGKDHADAHAAAGQGARPDAVDLGDDARPPLLRGRRHPLPFHRPPPVRPDEGRRRPARSRRSARQRLRHAARAGRGRARAGPRHAVRHRLAGRAAGARGAGSDVVSIFILPPSMAELRARLERRAEDLAATIGSGWRTPSARSSAGGYTITSSSTTICSAPTTRSSSIVAAERARCARVAEGVEDFVAKLLA